MLKPTQVSFQYLSDKRANFIFTSLAIPDMSGIHTGRVRYLPSCGKIVVLGLVRRELVPPVQHQPGQGMHYGLLETRLPNVPSYVSRVDYRGKGMTKKPTASFQKP